VSAGPIVYRDARPDDLPALVELDSICFEPGVAYPERLMKFFVRHPASHTIVAEQDGKPVGFVIARAARKAGEIVTIDVSPDVRRAGIGAELMRRAESSMQARGASAAYLEVDQVNQPAIRLYETFGWSVVERYVEHDGKPRFVMKKQLT
jgi:[ribosomal protein S18]-alanine N-acetyltransferase